MTEPESKTRPHPETPEWALPLQDDTRESRRLLAELTTAVKHGLLPEIFKAHEKTRELEARVLELERWRDSSEEPTLPGAE